MKKLTLILGFFIVCTDFVFSQLSGEGTEFNPYEGTITENTVWNTGSTIWAEDLIIDGCTLTISPGAYNGTYLNMIGANLTINSGSNFIINPLAAVSVTSLVNNGTLILESYLHEPGVASLIHDLYSGSGVNQLKLYLSGGITPGGSYIWHYISAPVSGVTAASFNTLDIAQYVESLATSSDNSTGWIAYDGYQYSSDIFIQEYAFSTLAIKKGYNYYSSSGATFTLTGTIYRGEDPTQNRQDLSYTGSSSTQGWNLIGNPFSSCLDWETICPTFTRSINNAIYFTNRGTYPSYVNGIGTDGGTQFIPPLQGFFVKATASNGRVIFNPSGRTHNLNQMRYKKGLEEKLNSSDTISFVRIQIINIDDSTDAVVRLNRKATTSVDSMFDAHKFSKTTGDLNIWTKTGNVDYSINGLPFPETKMEIPVGLNVKIPGTYRLWSNELNKLDDYSVTLRDLVTNHIVDLKKGESIIFNTPAGMIEDRFILTVTNLTTGIPEIPVREKKFSVYSSSGIINILSLTDEFSNTRGSVTIYDLTGRKIYQDNNTEWQGSGDLKQVAMNSGAKGLCFVEIRAGQRRYIEKVSLH